MNVRLHGDEALRQWARANRKAAKAMVPNPTERLAALTAEYKLRAQKDEELQRMLADNRTALVRLEGAITAFREMGGVVQEEPKAVEGE